MSKVIIMQGIQGSGKSTFAKNWVAEDPEHRVRWNNDDMRNMFGPYWIPEREKTHSLDAIKSAFISTYMKAGFDIVIDDMNLNPTTVSVINNLVSEYNKYYDVNYTTETHLMTTPIDVCIERDSKRPNPIGKKVIKDTFNRYQSYIVSEANKQYLATRENLVYDPELQDCVIVDLDGVLAFNVTGRPFYGKECAEKIKYDKYDTSMANLLYHIKNSESCKIIFLTGRSEGDGTKEATLDWLSSCVDVYNTELIMRSADDRRPGPECKKSLYEEHIKGKYNVLAVFEDQTKNVNMWRSLGLLCLQTCDCF